MKYFFEDTEKGFTFIETILYMAIIVVMLSSLIPFALNVIEGASTSSIQQEISSNARYVSERIKYEIRNASGINSISTASASLSETNALLNPTVITWTYPNVTLTQGATSAVNLNSTDTIISSFAFTNNSSTDFKTKNVSFLFTAKSASSSAIANFQSNVTIESSAELRGN